MHAYSSSQRAHVICLIIPQQKCEGRGLKTKSSRFYPTAEIRSHSFVDLSAFVDLFGSNIALPLLRLPPPTPLLVVTATLLLPALLMAEDLSVLAPLRNIRRPVPLLALLIALLLSPSCLLPSAEPVEVVVVIVEAERADKRLSVFLLSPLRGPTWYSSSRRLMGALVLDRVLVPSSEASAPPPRRRLLSDPLFLLLDDADEVSNASLLRLALLSPIESCNGENILLIPSRMVFTKPPPFLVGAW